MLAAVLPPFHPGAAFTAWTFDPLVVAGVVLAGGLYWAGLRRLSAGPPFPRSRAAAFYGGLAATVVALCSPVDVYADVSFSVHMLQHLLLLMVAAPLFALGAPVTLALRAVSPQTRRRFLLPVLHSRAFAALTHPFVAWVLFAAVQYVTHFTGFYEAALANHWVHVGEHALYLVSGLLFWWPIVGLDPSPRKLSYPARILYLVAAMPLEAFLGVAILSSGAALYPHYAALPPPWGGHAAVADQANAGALMWISGDLTALIAGLLVAAAWFRHDEARQRRIEEEEDRRAAAAADTA